MPGGSRSTWPRCGTARCACRAAYAYGTEDCAGIDRSTFDLALDAVGAMRTGRLVSATYPLERFEEAVAHAGAAGRRGAVKIAFDLRANDTRRSPMTPRPGFVLEVDGSTPPTLFWKGEGFSLERLPEGSRVIYAPEPLDRGRRPAWRRSATRSSTRSVTRRRCGPCSGRGCGSPSASTTSRSRCRPMQAPDVRQLVIEQVLDLAATAGVDDVVLIAALALHRRMTEAELRHALGDRVYEAFAPHGLLTQHDAEDPDNLVDLGQDRPRARTWRSTSGRRRATCSST